MPTLRRLHAALLRSILPTLAALSACGRVDAPPPSSTEGMASVDSLPALPPSYVSAPVSFDLRPVLADIEARLPRRIGSLEKRKKIPGKPLLVAVELERRPLKFSFGENSVAVEAVFRATFKLDLPGLAKGETMQANFAMFFEMKDGRIHRHRTYDCFQPW